MDLDKMEPTRPALAVFFPEGSAGGKMIIHPLALADVEIK